MILFLVKRLIWIGLTLWAVFTASFLLMSSVPGGPFQSERNMSPEVRLRWLERYDLDAPLHEQYTNQLTGLVTRFDLGLSMSLQDFTVNDVIAQGFPVSASLGIFALVFALALGLAAGMVSALWRQSIWDVALMSLATLGIALPNFVLASVLILLLVFKLPIFPSAGWGSLEQLVLPAICLGAPFAAYIARLTRTGLLEILSQDFIRTARAKGLPARRVVLRHALRGALLPVVSFLGPAIAGILTGSLVVERIFALPGLGSHFIEAATQRDYSLAMGMVLFYTALLTTMNLLVDLAYAWLDPRVKLD